MLRLLPATMKQHYALYLNGIDLPGNLWLFTAIFSQENRYKKYFIERYLRDMLMLFEGFFAFGVINYQ